jgi:hypothetical protein
MPERTVKRRPQDCDAALASDDGSILSSAAELVEALKHCALVNSPLSELQVIMDAKDTTRRINRRPEWCALDERKESRSRTFSAVRDTRLPMDQLQTVARHPPVIMMQSLESGAPDPKAQSSNKSLATPSEGSALGFRWFLVPLVLGLIAIWPL